MAISQDSSVPEKLYHWWLYVLKLEEGKFYVGITSKTPEIRMKEHIAKKRGAYWTMKYKPVELIEANNLGYVTKEQAEYLENKKTRLLMQQYGLNNVRGGDLKQTYDYVFRLGRFFNKEDWGELIYVFFVLLLLLLFFIDKYIVVILPGGVR